MGCGMRVRQWVLSGLLVAGVSGEPSIAAPVAVGNPAPAFSLRRLGGGELSLAQLRGKIVVLMFFTPDCSRCNVEAPHLQTVHREYSARGVRVVGIAPLSGPVRDLHAFADRHGLAFPILVDPREQVTARYRLQMYPLTMVIDARGTIRYVQRGFRTGDEKRLNQALVKLGANRPGGNRHGTGD